MADTKIQHKKAYIINCSTSFRDDILQLAKSKKVNVGDLARSTILALPQEMIVRFPDPGEPKNDDREKITLKSGDYEGKIWRRKPRLQARLPAGYQPILLRKALGITLALAAKEKVLTMQDANEEPHLDTINKVKEHNIRLLETIERLSFTPVRGGCTTATEALYILGLPKAPYPNQEEIKKRFRELAGVYHPDGILGDNDRMSQLNLAFAFLKHNR